MDIYSLGFSVSNLGPKSYQKLLNMYESPKNCWEASKKEYEDVGISGLAYIKFDVFRESFDCNKYLKLLEKWKVEFVSFTDSDYPLDLKQLVDPPIGLFVKGNKSLLREDYFRIGVVGTRKMTSYGKVITESLVGDLVRQKACIVSGLALGVDGMAHKTALVNDGTTIAVLACGVDCCNPTQNYDLFQRIIRNKGLIVSEYPLSSSPNKGTFLARNRIIAALSNGILITEAAEGSGSLVTAQYGSDLGKKIFAVPGQVGAHMSKGSISLLKRGAILVTESNDILENFAHEGSHAKKVKRTQANQLTKEERSIIKLINNEQLTIDQLCKSSKINITQLMVILSGLELKNIINISNGVILPVDSYN